VNLTFDFRCLFTSPPSSPPGAAPPSPGSSFVPQRERFFRSPPAAGSGSTAAPFSTMVGDLVDLNKCLKMLQLESDGNCKI
jgi:hypothetical protein